MSIALVLASQVTAAAQNISSFAYVNGNYLGPVQFTPLSAAGSGPSRVRVRLGYQGRSYETELTLGTLLKGSWTGHGALFANGGHAGNIVLGELSGLQTWYGTVMLDNSVSSFNFTVNNPRLPNADALRTYFRTQMAPPTTARLPRSGTSSLGVPQPDLVDPGGGGTNPNVQGVGVWGGPQAGWFYAEAVGALHLSPGGAAYWSNRVWLTNAGYNHFEFDCCDAIYNVQYSMTNTNGSAGFGLTPTQWIVLPNSGSCCSISVSVGYAGFSVSVSVPTDGCGCGSTAASSWTQSSVPNSNAAMLYQGENNSNGTAADHMWFMQSSTALNSTVTMSSSLTVQTTDVGVLTDYPVAIPWNISAN